MADFINTIDVLGDDAVIDSIIDRSITEFKDDTVTEIGMYAFANCSDLNTVDCPNVNTLRHFAFQNCSTLSSVNFPNLTNIIGSAIYGCSALRKIQFPAVTNLSAFQGNYSYLGNCTNLEVVDFGVLTNLQGNASFSNDRKIKALILRAPTVVSLPATSVFTYSSLEAGKTAYTCYIYVPGNLVDSYRSATNWSTYADQFRALEDYTVDGTTTGELDETKI